VRRSLHLILAALFSALTIPQAAVPVWALTLSSAPGFAIPFRATTRYPVEEVGSQQLEFSPASLTKLSPTVVVHSERDTTAAIRFTDNEVTDWPLKPLFHRRTSPPSADDGN
jgi:hypothetical protein